ncbi:uncharacterized protein F4822DRAFT_155041 [Hypoxylon trugodes]|uniref:uncharacterized protein n=1 Tax=Hypoxylon trugodes TaxID=326681 RepID=UPI00218D945F|nr:uncharacterized protein F4822DRAFT_155041 [Hypoxylon trugodes]KAI1390579.1 hypothetical protein F4822DRAFT_155041 [Hypoxylon trugodes]
MAPPSTVPPSIMDNPKDLSHGSGNNLDIALTSPDSELVGLGEEYPEWDPTIGFIDFLHTQTNDSYLPQASSSSSSGCCSTPSIEQAIGLQHGLSSASYSIPATPNWSVRSLIQRPRVQTGTQRIPKLIFHTLKSYPLMMMRYNTLPPLIHPSLVSADVENAHMEPLTNCISLVHMIGNGIQGSRKLFWQNVRRECERFSDEHQNFNRWELLAAMQALTIYVLLRLDEGETDHNNFDFLLVKAVVIIAQQISRSDIICHTQCALCNNGLETSWKEWVFRESRRRLAVVYRVVNMLIYFEPAAMCDLPSDFALAPLPARKQLWEAGDEFAWKLESQRDSGIQVSFGLAADGEIVKLDESQLSCGDAWLSRQSIDAKTPSRSTASWEEWCSGIDGFGGLVMLAASLIV